MGGWVWLPRGILLDPCFLILRILIYLVLESLDKGRNFRVEKSGLRSTELEVPWVRYLVLSWCRRESRLGCRQTDVIFLCLGRSDRRGDPGNSSPLGSFFKSLYLPDYLGRTLFFLGVCVRLVQCLAVFAFPTMGCFGVLVQVVSNSFRAGPTFLEAHFLGHRIPPA